MTYQTDIIKASHPTVWCWVHKLKRLTSHIPKKRRACIAVDETKEKLNGKQMFIWSAIDTESREMPSRVRITPAIIRQRDMVHEASPQDMHGKEETQDPCGRRAMVSHGHSRGYRVQVGARDIREEERDRERLLRTLKARTGLFYDNIKGRNAMTNLVVFPDLFLIWYNHLRKHQTDREDTGRGDLILTVSLHLTAPSR